RPQAVLLAGAGPDDVAIGGGDGQIADRFAAQAARDRLPGHPAVAGLPDAAAGRADVERLRARLRAVRHRDGRDAARVGGGAEGAEGEAVEEARDGVGLRGGVPAGRIGPGGGGSPLSGTRDGKDEGGEEQARHWTLEWEKGLRTLRLH